MNASSSPSTTTATAMAFSTKGAGPSLQSFSKLESRGESESCVRSALGALLIRRVAFHVLPRGYLEPQSTSVGLRGKTPDLSYLCEVFRAGRIERASGEPLRAPIRQWEFQARDSRRAPFGVCSREGATRTRRSQRYRPLPRQIDNRAAAQS